MSELIQKLRDSMIESTFSDNEQANLFALIRLTVEFHDYLQGGNVHVREYARKNPEKKWLNDPVQLNEFEKQYCIESIFGGIDAFCSVNSAYKILRDTSSSRVQWDKITTSTLRDYFILIFKELSVEQSFEKKCRLLLDLFKLQIVYAGMFYD